jgi:hypothetical protein
LDTKGLDRMRRTSKNKIYVKNERKQVNIDKDVMKTNGYEAACMFLLKLIDAQLINSGMTNEGGRQRPDISLVGMLIESTILLKKQ